MYTLEELVNKFFDAGKDYETKVKEFYRGGDGLEKQDEVSILYALESIREGNKESAVRSLESCDTEVREVFARMLIDDPKFDWNGNRR